MCLIQSAESLISTQAKRATPGMKAVGKAREHWKSLQARRGELIPIRLPSTPPNGRTEPEVAPDAGAGFKEGHDTTSDVDPDVAAPRRLRAQLDGVASCSFASFSKPSPSIRPPTSRWSDTPECRDLATTTCWGHLNEVNSQQLKIIGVNSVVLRARKIVENLLRGIVCLRERIVPCMLSNVICRCFQVAILDKCANQGPMIIGSGMHHEIAFRHVSFIAGR